MPDASLGGSGGSGGSSGSGGGQVDASIDVDTPDIDTPEGCLWPNKICDGKCVAYDDPDYGCTQDTCDPCPINDNTEYGCVNHECIVTGCKPGYYSCNGDPTDGCETDIWSADNCGTGQDGCGHPCSPSNTDSASCLNGQCTIVKCKELFADCNNDPNDGCETNLRDIHNCGECGKECTVSAGSEPTCSSGVCKVNVCPPGKADCDSNPADCETDITTTQNCGACGNVCAGPNVNQWACVASGGQYACQITACAQNWGNCNGQIGDGCEVNLNSATDHCGSCGGKCSTHNATAQACNNGQCIPTCIDGFKDCNGPRPGATDDGCETNVRTPQNCGACGTTCAPAHATPDCSLGICGIKSCETDWVNCDGNVATGCEINISLHVDHCGGCSRICSANHIPTRACSGGQCTGACESGWADCNNNKQTDGCETNISTNISTCGGCNLACSANHVPSRTCVGGKCSGGCESGWADCDGNKQSNGCETSINSNVSHCGGCNLSCSANHVPSPTCTGGQCTGGCESGWEDCDNNKQSNGCEANTSTNPNHCGGCGNSCPAGFNCQGAFCRCLTSLSCLNGGECTSGRCRCDGTLCDYGQVCSPSGYCSF